MTEAEPIDYIEQTQPVDYDQVSEQANSHLASKQTPIGVIKKPIQKPRVNNLHSQKNPIPKQFMNKQLQHQKNRQQVQQNYPKVQQQQVKQVAKNDLQVQNQQKKNKREWKSYYVVRQLNSVDALDLSLSSTKRFKVQFTYEDTRTKKLHHYTLRFGKRKISYVIDGVRDQTEALLKQALIRKADNPFSSNYWALWLLNKTNGKSIEQNIADYRIAHKIQ